MQAGEEGNVPQPSPLATASPCKSMPALHSSYNKESSASREENELCLSMDTLYHGEDEEMEFLDSFLDYDSISIVSPSKHHETRENEEEEQAEEVEEILHSVIADAGEEVQSRKRKAGLKERMAWLASRGKVNMRGLSSSGSVASLQGSLRSSRERLSEMRRGFARSTERINTVFRFNSLT